MSKLLLYCLIIVGVSILFIYLYNAKKQADQQAQFNSIIQSGNQQINSLSGQSNALVGLVGEFTGTDLVTGALGGGGSSSGSSSGSTSGGKSGGSSSSWTSLLALF